MFFKEMGPKNSKSILSGGKLNRAGLTIEENAKKSYFGGIQEFKWRFNGYDQKKIVKYCGK